MCLNVAYLAYLFTYVFVYLFHPNKRNGLPTVAAESRTLNAKVT